MLRGQIVLAWSRIGLSIGEKWDVPRTFGRLDTEYCAVFKHGI